MSSNSKSTYFNSVIPFIMHLEKVCQLIEMEHPFTIEFNPCSDITDMVDGLIQGVRVHIHENGNLSIHLPNGIGISTLRLTLSNYKRVWRCWQNGIPTKAQRDKTRWSPHNGR